MRSPNSAVKPLTGKHMAMIFVGFFGVVIGVNLVMANFALSTFGGTVVDNSYVASQKYNGWLAQGRAQQALGWTVAMVRDADGRVAASVTDASGNMLAGAKVTGMAEHPLGRTPPMSLDFRQMEHGYVSDIALPDGRWTIRLTVTADGKRLDHVGDVK